MEWTSPYSERPWVHVVTFVRHRFMSSPLHLEK
jgi:hypothetical protein